MGDYTYKKALRISNAFLSLAGIFLIAELAIVFYINQPLKIAVVDMATEETIFSEEVEYGERFKVNYIHSVERSPVSEIFEVRKTAYIQWKVILNLSVLVCRMKARKQF